jgi:oligopeptide transport system substrate-binding protein
MIKKALLASVTGILLMSLAACGERSDKTAQKAAESISTMAGDVITTMDPARATDAISAQAMANVYAGLYRYDGKELTPDMASHRAKVSADQLTYTFTIRKNARWSDGRAVTAQDFVYAWRRAVNPATKSEYAYLFSGIKNADAIISGKKPASSLGVTAQGHILTVHLSHVIPYFEPLMTLKTFYPVEAKQVRQYGDKFGTSSKTLTFNGPYVLQNWQSSDNHWTQRKNSRYWNAKNVHVQTLKSQVVKDNGTALNLFQAGKLDDVSITGDTARQMQTSSDYKVVAQNATFYIEMTQSRVPAFKSQKVRQALSMVINRRDFIDQVLGDGSQPASSVIPSGMTYSSANGADFAKTVAKKTGQYSQYNLRKARALFAAGMQELQLKSASFTIVSDDTDNAKDTLTYLQSAFSKLSSSDAKLTVHTQSVPFKTRVQMSQEHKADMVVSAWGANYPDPISFLDLFTSNNAYNSGQWHNSRYDALVKAASTTDAANANKRWADLQAATKILTKDVGVIAFYQRGAAHLSRSSIKGMQLSPNGVINFVGVTNK